MSSRFEFVVDRDCHVFHGRKTEPVVVANLFDLFVSGALHDPASSHAIATSPVSAAA
jgi:hypothetical protein